MTKGVSSAMNTEQCDLCGVRGMISEDGVGVEAGQGEIRVYSTAAVKTQNPAVCWQAAPLCKRSDLLPLASTGRTIRDHNSAKLQVFTGHHKECTWMSMVYIVEQICFELGPSCSQFSLRGDHNCFVIIIYILTDLQVRYN